MPLSRPFHALARIFVAACVGTADETRSALAAVRASGAAPRDVDETLLLVVAYAGVPRAILAFTDWRLLQQAVSVVPDVADRRAAGDAAFDAVYGTRADRVRQELRSLHPVLRDAILEDSYGRILARSGLSARDRELLAVP